MLLTILTANSVSKIFISISLYERALRMKNLPVLRNHVPKSQSETTAYQVMSPLVLTVQGIVGVDYLSDILQKPYSMYPVLNTAGNIVGMMPKNFLIVLIENHHWMDVKMLSENQTKRLKMLYFPKYEDKKERKRALSETRKRIANKIGTLGPQDWYLKEFSKKTLAYFKENNRAEKQFKSFT